jgi:hypothetical protein
LTFTENGKYALQLTIKDSLGLETKKTREYTFKSINTSTYEGLVKKSAYNAIDGAISFYDADADAGGDRIEIGNNNSNGKAKTIYIPLSEATAGFHVNVGAAKAFNLEIFKGAVSFGLDDKGDTTGTTAISDRIEFSLDSAGTYTLKGSYYDTNNDTYIIDRTLIVVDKKITGIMMKARGNTGVIDLKPIIKTQKGVAVKSYRWECITANTTDIAGSPTNCNFSPYSESKALFSIKRIPALTFTKAGTYNIQLTITDSLGATETKVRKHTFKTSIISSEESEYNAILNKSNDVVNFSDEGGGNISIGKKNEDGKDKIIYISEIKARNFYTNVEDARFFKLKILKNNKTVSGPSTVGDTKTKIATTGKVNFSLYSIGKYILEGIYVDTNGGLHGPGRKFPSINRTLIVGDTEITSINKSGIRGDASKIRLKPIIETQEGVRTDKYEWKCMVENNGEPEIAEVGKCKFLASGIPEPILEIKADGEYTVELTITNSLRVTKDAKQKYKRSTADDRTASIEEIEQ